MAVFSDEALQNMEELLSTCDHILEKNIPDCLINDLRERAAFLQKQSDEYNEYLADQENNSRSAVSRTMASLFLSEDKRILDQLEQLLPDTEKSIPYLWSDADVNVGALYVEYLTDRARQSIREALISAIKLKLLSEENEQKINYRKTQTTNQERPDIGGQNAEYYCSEI